LNSLPVKFLNSNRPNSILQTVIAFLPYVHPTRTVRYSGRERTGTVCGRWWIGSAALGQCSPGP